MPCDILGKRASKSLSTYGNFVTDSLGRVWFQRWIAGILSRKQYDRVCQLLSRWKMAAEVNLDIFHHMNQLNKLLQVSGENLLTSSNKILRFKRSLNLWKYHVAKENFVTFQLLLGIKSKGHYQIKSYWN